MKKIEIKRLQHNNVFYYAGKVYILGLLGQFRLSAMEAHSEGKHRTFKPDTKVLFISPSFVKKITGFIGCFEESKRNTWRIGNE